jgi:hypothetical protein
MHLHQKKSVPGKAQQALLQNAVVLFKDNICRIYKGCACDLPVAVTNLIASAR